MKATTELSAFGTWQDPESVSNDQRADNVLLEVEYGEIDGELVGHGIVRALSLINSLKSMTILYARMINIETRSSVSRPAAPRHTPRSATLPWDAPRKRGSMLPVRHGSPDG
jgi:hypothetical protein